MRTEIVLIIFAFLIHRCTNFVINTNFRTTKSAFSEKIMFFGRKATVLKIESTIVNDQRPNLNRSISIQDFNDFYWKKNELVDFCKINNLSFYGNKVEITQRIGTFLSTGQKMYPVKKYINSQRDSQSKLLTPDTVVVNYKSDKITRDFFIREIGEHFVFKSVVLNWIKEQQQQNITLTYKNIICKWKEICHEENDPFFQRIIQKQFQFNQFMRDWKLAKAGSGAKKAWTFIRSHRGSPTFAHYMQVNHQQLKQNQNRSLIQNNTSFTGTNPITKK